MAERIKIAKVQIWGKAVGVVFWDPIQKIARFQYDPEFVKLGIQLSPICMPLSDKIYSFRHLNFETYMGLPGLLADCLPDTFGHKMIDAWLAQEGRSKTDFSPVERLCYIGQRGMGALEFQPVLSQKHRSFPLEIPRLFKLANQIFYSKQRFKSTFGKKDFLEDIWSVGTSAGGQHPKVVIAINKETGQVRSGQVKVPEGFEYWLLKFDEIDKDHKSKGYGKIEYAYYLMAKAMGIQISECDLYRENGRVHFMTKRFDREKGQKHHLQTLCGIAHYDYKSPGAYSYEQAFQVMRKLHLPYGDFEELFKRMVFNIVARNQDDHTKNISFLLKKGEDWRLSPAYDLTFSFNPKGAWTSQHQMTMNGKTDHFIKDDFMQTAHSIGIKNAKEILKEAIDVIKNWPEFAKQAGVHQGQIHRIAKQHRLKF